MGKNHLSLYASFVKLEHSVFSLPVVFAGVLLGLHRWPSLRLAVLILAAAVSGRVLGMALNRLFDAEIDARNPRTKNRELPRRAITKAEGWVVVLASGAIYFVAAWAIAPVCYRLSPIPVILFFIYPYLKRATLLSHLGLGLAWSMGPVGGWLAAVQDLSRVKETFWIWLFSVCWVTGFDIIYATMDEAFDRAEGLHSLPAALGTGKALRIAALLHGAAFAALSVLWLKQLHSDLALAWLFAIGVLLIWQHIAAKKNPEFAFFKLNGAIGFLVLGLLWSGI